jgi:hypothetical protein
MVRSTLSRFIAHIASAGRAAPPAPERRIATTGRVPEEALMAATPPLPASLRDIVNPNRIFENPELFAAADGTWRFRARMGEGCERLRVCIDHAAQAEADAVGWRARARLTLRTYADLAAGEAVEFDVVDHHEARPATWCWSCDPKADESLCTDVDITRCRLAFIADERQEQSFYFVVQVVPGNPPRPILLGENLFAYKDSWEAESPLDMPPRWRGR